MAQAASGEAQREEEREGEGAAGAEPEEREQGREEDVELLLDAEGPGVQERQAIGVGAEIVELAARRGSWRPRGRWRRWTGRRSELVGGEPGDGDRDAGEEDGGERGQDAAGAALVEAGEGEAAAARSRARMPVMR